MKRVKLLAIAFFVAAALLLSLKPAHASEGTAELSSPTQKARCFVSSVLLKDFNHKLVVSCRDLVYPPAQNLFSYILWINPQGGGNPQKLGELGVGKADFGTNTTFTELFVTSETNDRVRSPSNRVIMRGSLQPITHLEGEVEAAVAPPEREEPAEEFGEIIAEPTPTPTIAPQPGVLGGIRRVGLIAIIALFIIVLIIAAITRSRG